MSATVDSDDSASSNEDTDNEENDNGNCGDEDNCSNNGNGEGDTSNVIEENEPEPERTNDLGNQNKNQNQNNKKKKNKKKNNQNSNASGNNNKIPDIINENSHSNFSAEAHKTNTRIKTNDVGNKENNNNGNKNQNNESKNKQNGMVNELKSQIQILVKEEQFQPLNSWLIRLHYRGVSLLFCICFVIVWHQWFSKELITCVGGYDATKPVIPTCLNICLSYSFIKENGKHRFLLFYRWVHFSLFLLSGMFYLPRVFMKKMGNPIFKALVIDLQRVSHWYKTRDYERIREEIVNYFKENLGTHRPLYYLYIFNHALCTAISVFTFYFLDYILQGQFKTLHMQFPYFRNPHHFNDTLSLAFPPFTTCIISPKTMKMLSAREETFYCHLTLMELYEKVFIVIWAVLILLIICNYLCLSILLISPLPPFNRYYLSTKLTSQQVATSKRYLMSNLNIGDIFALYIIKGLVNEKQFCRILLEIKEVVEMRKELENMNMSYALAWKIEFESYTSNFRSRKIPYKPLLNSCKHD